MEELQAQRPERLKPKPDNSPEFEFWMVRNPSFPQPNQLSADELFSDGILLPLDLLQGQIGDDPPDPNTHSCKAEPETSGSGRPESEPEQGPGISAAVIGSSKRWKDIFKKGEKKDVKEVKEKRKEKKNGGNGVVGGGAELNINIWPFSRSRSAGNGGSRPRVTAGSGLPTRKVSSAPCSRSNSAGESKSRKWPSSPSRGGVHLGRSSPVWQVRRSAIPGSGNRSSEILMKTKDTGSEKVPKKEINPNPEKGVKKLGSESRRKVTSAATSGGPKAARVLNLNVPMCIGYKHHLGCRSDENSAISFAGSSAAVDGGGGGGAVTGEGVRGSNNNLFNIRSLFTKKVY